MLHRVKWQEIGNVKGFLENHKLLRWSFISGNFPRRPLLSSPTFQNPWSENHLSDHKARLEWRNARAPIDRKDTKWQQRRRIRHDKSDLEPPRPVASPRNNILAFSGCRLDPARGGRRRSHSESATRLFIVNLDRRLWFPFLKSSEVFKVLFFSLRQKQSRLLPAWQRYFPFVKLGFSIVIVIFFVLYVDYKRISDDPPPPTYVPSPQARHCLNPLPLSLLHCAAAVLIKTLSCFFSINFAAPTSISVSLPLSAPNLTETQSPSVFLSLMKPSLQRSYRNSLLLCFSTHSVT